MVVVRTSMISGKVHSMNLDITVSQMNRYLHGEKVQDAFPNLSAEEREFIHSGITPEEWEATFPES